MVAIKSQQFYANSFWFGLRNIFSASKTKNKTSNYQMFHLIEWLWAKVTRLQLLCALKHSASSVFGEEIFNDNINLIECRLFEFENKLEQFNQILKITWILAFHHSVLMHIVFYSICSHEFIMPYCFWA